MCCTQRNKEQNIMTQLRIWRFSEENKKNQYISDVYLIYYLINSQ